MNNSLTKYQDNIPTRVISNKYGSVGLILIVALALLTMWLISRGKSQYNEEKVVIERDERGRIAGMSVHRSAH